MPTESLIAKYLDDLASELARNHAISSALSGLHLGDTLRRYLRYKGYRLTPQRELVLKAVDELGHAIAAVGEAWCFVIDSASYLAVIGSLARMRAIVPQVPTLRARRAEA